MDDDWFCRNDDLIQASRKKIDGDIFTGRADDQALALDEMTPARD